MKNLIRHSVIFLTFLILFSSKSVAADRILPLPKPSVDQDTKAITAKKKEIYPQKKPKIEEVKETIDTSKTTSEISEVKEEEIFIYPEKKPIVVQKKVDKTVAKSEVLSKKDFKIAKAVFKAIDKKKWQTAIKLSKKSRDKNLYNLVNYLYLIKTINAASFYDYSVFINNNPNYPRYLNLFNLG